jgi:hypothetical protein
MARDVLLEGVGLELWIEKQMKHVALFIASREKHLHWVNRLLRQLPLADW